MVNCTVCQDIEKVACKHPSRHDPETNQRIYLCPKLFMSLGIVTSCTITIDRATSCDFQSQRTYSKTSLRLILIVRLFVTAKTSRTMFLQLSRSTIHKMVRMSFKAYVQFPGIFDCSVRRLNMLEDRRSPPHNRFCWCDCSRSLRLVVRSSKIACDYCARLVLYRSQTGRKRS